MKTNFQTTAWRGENAKTRPLGRKNRQPGEKRQKRFLNEGISLQCFIYSCWYRPPLTDKFTNQSDWSNEIIASEG